MTVALWAVAVNALLADEAAIATATILLFLHWLLFTAVVGCC